MPTYSQYYRAGRIKAAKKMNAEQRAKLRKIRKNFAIKDGYVSKEFNLCRGCAYLYNHICTYDDTENPTKIHCEWFVKNKKWRGI